jgi:hypothetical protein
MRMSKLSESWIQMESPWPTSMKETVRVVVVVEEGEESGWADVPLCPSG